MVDGGGLNKGSSSRVYEKLFNPVYILKVELKRFPDGLLWVVKKSHEDSRGTDLSEQRLGASFTEMDGRAVSSRLEDGATEAQL